MMWNALTFCATLLLLSVAISSWTESVATTPETWTIIVDSARAYARPEMSRNSQTRNRFRYGQNISVAEVVKPPGAKIEWLRLNMRNRASLFVPEPMAAPVPSSWTPAQGNLPIGGEQVDRQHTLPLNYAPQGLVAIDLAHCLDGEREYLLLPEAHASLMKMIEAAGKQGVTLKVVSAYRGAEYQRGLYQRKTNVDLAQRTVARPGQSEHQLGTTVDLAGANPECVLENCFGATPEGQWLREHCREFGFVQSYTEKNQEQTGYVPEAWHFRYVGVEQTASWR
jgi:LAS superfamily LD-carboxypeptidase LdcB